MFNMVYEKRSTVIWATVIYIMMSFFYLTLTIKSYSAVIDVPLLELFKHLDSELRYFGYMSGILSLLVWGLFRPSSYFLIIYLTVTTSWIGIYLYQDFSKVHFFSLVVYLLVSYFILLEHSQIFKISLYMKPIMPLNFKYLKSPINVYVLNSKGERAKGCVSFIDEHGLVVYLTTALNKPRYLGVELDEIRYVFECSIYSYSKCKRVYGLKLNKVENKEVLNQMDSEGVSLYNDFIERVHSYGYAGRMLLS